MKLRNKKTKEIVDLAKRGLLKSDNDNHIIVYPEGTLKYYAYHSLAELNEEWEDCKPKEPLIKDENIREAVRAWAKVQGDTKFDVNGGCLVTTFKGLNSLLEIDFKCSWLQNGVYTIDELCGEKE